jgi:hypothetical protein
LLSAVVLETSAARAIHAIYICRDRNYADSPGGTILSVCAGHAYRLSYQVPPKPICPLFLCATSNRTDIWRVSGLHYAYTRSDKRYIAASPHHDTHRLAHGHRKRKSVIHCMLTVTNTSKPNHIEPDLTGNESPNRRISIDVRPPNALSPPPDRYSHPQS